MAPAWFLNDGVVLEELEGRSRRIGDVMRTDRMSPAAPDCNWTQAPAMPVLRRAGSIVPSPPKPVSKDAAKTS